MSYEKIGKDRNSLKIVLLGDRAVGKSCIAKRFIEDQFNQFSHPTVGVDFMSKNLKYNNQSFKIQLWDTAGQQKYRSLAKNYLRNAHACIFVYDVTNVQTYFSIPKWMETLHEACKIDDVYSIIVGNKCDDQFDLEKLEQQKQQFKNLKTELENKDELMTSAKLGININKVFENILQNYIEKKKNKALQFQTQGFQSLTLQKMIVKMKTRCCF